MNLAPSCSSRRAASKYVLDDLERSRSNVDLRSRSGHDLVAYHMTRLVNTNTLVPIPRLYLHSITSYRQKRIYDLVTSDDLSPRPLRINCILIITDGLVCHNS